MNFNSPNDLYPFLYSKNLTGLCPETQNLVACMDVFVRMCTCDPQDKKQAKYNQCQQSYIAFASRAGNFTSQLLEKAATNRINFYLNGQLLSTVSR